MKPPDEFGSYYGSLIEASYDCVDRLTINAYFPLGQTAGGFRSWWRQWQGGEQRLNEAGLKGAAGDLARRLKAWCLKGQIPWIECKAREAKYVLARELRPKDPNFRGVLAVLVGRAPAPVWEVRHNQAGKITELRPPETWPHVQHYYFQIQDPQWGHIVVRLCGYPPWGAQLILNGHEWVERAACRARVKVSKAGNCLVEGTNYGAVDRLAERYSVRRAAYDLAKLRGKEVVEKRPGTRRYQCRVDKFSALCGYVVVCERVLKPLMAGAAPGPVGPAPKRPSALDQRYLAIQVHMKRLFQTLGLNTNAPAN